MSLGVRFTADTSGCITGIRFYKGSGNTGTHVGQLWSAGGTLLGQVTFSNESVSGWQEADFAAPVPVTAGTTYIASYFAPRGDYVYDLGGFASTGWTARRCTRWPRASAIVTDCTSTVALRRSW